MVGVPNFKNMVVGHYNFIDTEVHGKDSYRMLCETESFQKYSDLSVRIYNELRRMK